MSRVQSIERAFSVLAALSDGPSGVTTIAARSHLPKSTVVRLLRALQSEDAVEQDTDGGHYRLGRRVADLASSFSPPHSLVTLARPFLRELATATGEAAGLSVPEEGEAHYIDQVDTPNPIAVRDWTGSRVPFHAASSGQVFLAHLPAPALDAYLAQPLERFTERTLVDPLALRERVRAVALHGVAWAHDEFMTGLSSVAAPVAGQAGEVIAALHVHGPSYRFPGDRGEAEVGALVAAAATRLSRRLRA